MGNSNRDQFAEQIWLGKDEPAPNSEFNERIVKRFFEEVWNKGNLEVVDEVLAPGFTDHNLPPGARKGLQGYKANVNNFRSAFPDITYSLDHIVTEGDRVAIRLTGKGTHKGLFMGIPATNKQVTFGGMTFVRIEDGKVVERWGLADIPSLLKQISPDSGPPPTKADSKYQNSQVIHVAPAESHSTTRVLGVTNMCKATKNETGGLFSFFVSTVPPGESVPIHIHKKEDEAYYILDGIFEIYDKTNNQTLTVGKDSYVYVPKGINHGFKNVGETPASMILIITPGGLEGFFEEIGQLIDDPNNPPAPMDRQVDFGVAAKIAEKYNITFVPPSG